MLTLGAVRKKNSPGVSQKEQAGTWICHSSVMALCAEFPAGLAVTLNTLIKTVVSRDCCISVFTSGGL